MPLSVALNTSLSPSLPKLQVPGADLYFVLSNMSCSHSRHLPLSSSVTTLLETHATAEFPFRDPASPSPDTILPFSIVKWCVVLDEPPASLTVTTASHGLGSWSSATVSALP